MLARPKNSTLGIILSCAALVAVAGLYAHYDNLLLRRPELFSGYILIITMVLPSLFGVRKKLSVLPLGTMAFWTRLHVAVGFTLLPLYWLHAGASWPDGVYEQVLAGLFYFVTFSGLVGWLMQSRFPRRLTQTGMEIQFERIPSSVILCRQQVENMLLEYQRETGNDTLARHYVENLSWYFFRPRFLLNHLFGGELHQFWLRGKFRAINRYLGNNEKPYLEKLQALADEKGIIDFHYTLQGLLKLWLFIHIPAATSLMVLAAWHFAAVHIYSI
jgi:hypothetical protein